MILLMVQYFIQGVNAMFNRKSKKTLPELEAEMQVRVKNRNEYLLRYKRIYDYILRSNDADKIHDAIVQLQEMRYVCITLLNMAEETLEIAEAIVMNKYLYEGKNEK